MKRLELLDCTLRDGAYIVNAEFGSNAISGIIKSLQDANVDIIECGWLKDTPHKYGTTYYHLPDDLKQYLTTPKNKYSTYVAMIDYNRYDCTQLPQCDGETIDAIRVVFPKDKFKEGIALVEPIRQKGYRVFLQAANTLGYTDAELLELIEAVNDIRPEGLSIVDTFGAMYPSDLLRIISLVNNNLDKNIKLGFHSHNNQQLSFALSMQFVDELMKVSGRKIVIDSSLCGMGRGAGNTNTELLSYYLNNCYDTNYDMNVIMDTIDVYMTPFMKNNEWGYTIPHSLAGMYSCHVNNIAYLIETHRTRSKDMKIIFESLSKDKRIQYDYDNLEDVYRDYMNKKVDDSHTKQKIKTFFEDKKILAILPGASSQSEFNKIMEQRDNDTVVIGINSIMPIYDYDWLFFSNNVKYNYARENYVKKFECANKILVSSIDALGRDDEFIINGNDWQKRGWKYYDNSMITFLRFMAYAQPSKILIAGFDGYQGNNQYAEGTLVPNLSDKESMTLQHDIEDMLCDFARSNSKIHIECITKSPFSEIFEK